MKKQKNYRMPLEVETAIAYIKENYREEMGVEMSDSQIVAGAIFYLEKEIREAKGEMKK